MILPSFGELLYMFEDSLFLLVWGLCVFYMFTGAFKIAARKKPLIHDLSHFRLFVYAIIGCMVAAELVLIVEYMHSENWDVGVFYFSDMITLLSVMAGTWLLLFWFVKNAHKLESIAAYSFVIYILLALLGVLLSFTVKSDLVFMLIGLLVSVACTIILFLPLFCYGKYIIVGAEFGSVENSIRHSVRHNMGVGYAGIHLARYFGKAYLSFSEYKNQHERAVIASMYEYWGYVADKDNAPSIRHLLRAMLVPTVILTHLAWAPVLVSVLGI